jgi:hypothetical protein
MPRRLTTAVFASLGLIAAACDSDESTTKSAGGGELWLIQTRVFSDDDGAMGYVIPTDKLSGRISNEESIEQGGGGMVYAAPGDHSGSFLLSYAERPTLTRYEATDDNRFETGETLSFANYGVDSGYGVIAWVDEHTAYWADSGQLQLIRFDPTEMKVKAAIPIDGIDRAGFVTEFAYATVRDDAVYLAAQWRKDWEDPMPEAPKGSALIRVDPANDDVTVAHDDRCTSMLVAKTTPSGDTYWFSNNYNSYARIIGGEERGVPDCALRQRKGEREFDADWELNIPERTGGLPGDGVIAGPGSTIWLRVYDVSEVDEPPTDTDSADVSPGWQWYSLDLDSDEPAVKNEQRPLSGHGGFGQYASGRSFVTVENEDYSETKLLELTEDGFEQLASVEGLVDGMVRVR